MRYGFKEVNIVPISAVLGKYTVPTIKSVLVLLQNVLKKIPSCTVLYQLVLADIGVSARTTKTNKKLIFLFNLIY